MNFNTLSIVSLPLLKEFVYEAKRQAFAATDVKSTLPDQTSVYSHRPFNEPRFAGMIYCDTYSGNTIEGGQESVTIDLVLRWRNQYYGGTVSDFWNTSINELAKTHFNRTAVKTGMRFPELVSAFLKQALQNTPVDFPVRGPQLYRAEGVVFENTSHCGEWEYVNEWKAIRLFDTEDPFASYAGQERIYLNGIEVYWHAYHGGLIRDKYFPLLIAAPEA